MKHVDHMLDVVQHQGHQHVLMEYGFRHRMDIHQQIRTVTDVQQKDDVQLRITDEHVHHTLDVVQRR